MKKQEKIKQLNKILIYLSAENDTIKVSAINSFIKLGEKETIPRKYLNQMLDIAKEELSNDKSSIHSELYNLLSKISIPPQRLISEFIPLLKNTIQQKKSFQLENVMNIISHYGNNPQPEIKAFIEDILTSADQYFGSEDLEPHFISFLEKVTNRNNYFLLAYENLINNIITSNNENLKESIEILKEKRFKLQTFQKNEKERKEKEHLKIEEEREKQKKREKERKLSEQLKEKLKEEIGNKKQEDLQESVNISKEDIILDNDNSQTTSESEKSDQISNELKKSIIDDGGPVSFTSLGLKRKKDSDA